MYRDWATGPCLIRKKIIMTQDQAGEEAARVHEAATAQAGRLSAHCLSRVVFMSFVIKCTPPDVGCWCLFLFPY